MTAHNTTAVAEKFETDARTLRKFLRSDANDISPVGKGKRYAIEGKDLRSLRSKFNKWAEDRAREAAAEEDAMEVAEEIADA